MSSLYNLSVKTLKNTDWQLGSLRGKVSFRYYRLYAKLNNKHNALYR